MKESLRKGSNSKHIFFPTIFLLIIFADLLTKSFWVQTCNKDFAFGLGSAHILIPLVALVVVGILLIRNGVAKIRLSYLLILAGGFSNVLDRIFVGCVRDFITIGFWPSFNLADAVITAGVLMLLINDFKKAIK